MSKPFDLRDVPTVELKAELARRQLMASIPKKTVLFRRQKWICECGSEYVAGDNNVTIFGLNGHAWCRICYPGGRICFSNGKRPVPMKQIDA
jgi:hypothetical protein